MLCGDDGTVGAAADLLGEDIVGIDDKRAAQGLGERSASPASYQVLLVRAWNECRCAGAEMGVGIVERGAVRIARSQYERWRARWGGR